MKIYKAERIVDTKYDLAEGPYYDPRYNRLSWVNIPEGTVNTLIGGVCNSVKVGSTVGAAIPLRDSEGFLACCTDGLYVLEDGEVTCLVDMKNSFKSFQRCNDAKCDKMGRLWFGSSSDNEDIGFGGDLYLFSGGEVTKVISETGISNGMAWSADGKKFYWADSPEHKVFVFDYDMDTGSISNRRTLCEINDGVPDGLCIDSNDNLWIAVWGGRRVENRDGITGELIGKIDVDANNVTCCCFGGSNNDELFITTSGANQQGAGDGCIYKCDLDVKGPENNYFGK